MFLPKGLSVLNCHACVLRGTKGAYVKNEQWIRVIARETETKRESKWFCKHRWLSLASVLVLHKCFEDVLFFPRPPNFSFTATVLLFLTVFVCLRLMSRLSANHNIVEGKRWFSQQFDLVRQQPYKMQVETTTKDNKAGVNSCVY